MATNVTRAGYEVSRGRKLIQKKRRKRRKKGRRGGGRQDKELIIL